MFAFANLCSGAPSGRLLLPASKELEPAHLLGALIINAFRQAADTFPQPNPYSLVIDEFQNFGTRVISTILSESGKRGLSLTLAHQFLSQLDEEVRGRRARQLLDHRSFRVGAEDAEIIGRAIDVAPQNLMDLGRGKAYRRTLLNDAPSTLKRERRSCRPDGLRRMCG